MTRLRLAVDPQAPECDLPLAPGSASALAAWQARVGEILTFQAPDGTFWRGRLLPGEASARLFQRLEASPEPAAPRRLWQAVPDRERMEWILQKAVELGATEIRPLFTARSNQSGQGRPRQDKSATWGRIVRDAARQCRRAELPVLAPPLTLEEALALPAPGGERVWLEVAGARQSLASL
ncbi:MAG: RsmE family RNA methyltransferase, partial [Magnetococcales bacterium]|nr:RsmE family RNA methyltransferase [Magnetococcales bacterium]